MANTPVKVNIDFFPVVRIEVNEYLSEVYNPATMKANENIRNTIYLRVSDLKDSISIFSDLPPASVADIVQPSDSAKDASARLEMAVMIIIAYMTVRMTVSTQKRAGTLLQRVILASAGARRNPDWSVR